MFPAMDKEVLAEVLNVAGSADLAVDLLLQMSETRTSVENTQMHTAVATQPRAALPSGQDRISSDPNAAAHVHALVPPAAVSPPSSRAPRVTFKKGLFRSGPRVVRS